MVVVSAPEDPIERPILLLLIATTYLEYLRGMGLLPDILAVVVRHDNLLEEVLPASKVGKVAFVAVKVRVKVVGVSRVRVKVAGSSEMRLKVTGASRVRVKVAFLAVQSFLTASRVRM